MPEHDEFDERLVQRLRAYESRIPDGEIPMTAPQAPRRSRSPLAAGGVIAIGALAASWWRSSCSTDLPGETGESPSPSASGQSTPVGRGVGRAERKRRAALGRAIVLCAGGGDTPRPVIFVAQGTATIGHQRSVRRGHPRLRRCRAVGMAQCRWSGPGSPASFTDDPGAESCVRRPSSRPIWGTSPILATCTTECVGGPDNIQPTARAGAALGATVTGGILAHLAAGGPGVRGHRHRSLRGRQPGRDADGPHLCGTGRRGRPKSLPTCSKRMRTRWDRWAIGWWPWEEPGECRDRTAPDGSWISADGRSWERYDDDSDRAAAFDIAWNGQELMAVGQGECPVGIGLGNQ